MEEVSYIDRNSDRCRRAACVQAPQADKKLLSYGMFFLNLFLKVKANAKVI